MKGICLVLFLIFISPSWGELAGLSSKLPDCKDWQPSDWDKYIEANLPLPGRFYDNITKLQENCAANVRHHNLNSCLDRINRYLVQFYGPIGVGGSYSTQMSDHDYLHSEPQEVMQLPPEFGTDHLLPENWKEIAEQNNWPWVLFPSDTGPSGRLVMRIPARNGEKYDRLLVYYANNAPCNQDPTTYDGVQMQAIEKVDEGSPHPPKYWLRAWDVDHRDGKPKVDPFGLRCVKCHMTGPRAIYPKKDVKCGVKTGGVANVEQFNNLVLLKHQPDLSAYYDLKHFPTKLKIGAMDQCASCHNGTDGRASLAFSVAESGDFFAVNVHRKVVQEKSMPRDPLWDLSDEDRKEIVSSVTKDYNEQLKNWLTEEKCAKPATPSSPLMTVPSSK